MNTTTRVKLYSIIGVLVLLAAIVIVWNNRYLLNSQPRLDNKYYPLELDSIKVAKNKLRKRKAKQAELSQAFVQLITNKVFPYWYGTPWDFNGTTEIPNEGKIACGYFVTTTLRDMGVPIDRVKMARCASEVMIRHLTSKKNVHYLIGINIEEFERRIKKYGYGLYIVGLDTHTGFILLSEEGNYFIHSSGAYPFQVVKEKLSESELLSKSHYRVVGKISDDELFLRKWVRNRD